MTIKSNIWFTYKSRINAEDRYKHYNLIVNILIIAYSFALICLSIYQGYSDDSGVPGFVQLILSVGVFTLSSLAFGANYQGTAADFRECYLRLGKLKNSNQSEQELTQEYDNLLAGYQNHHHDDYLKVIIDSKLGRGEVLTDASGQVITLTKFVYIKYFFKRFIYLLGLLLCFTPPTLIVLYIAIDYFKS